PRPPSPLFPYTTLFRSSRGTTRKSAGRDTRKSGARATRKTVLLLGYRNQLGYVHAAGGKPGIQLGQPAGHLAGQLALVPDAVPQDRKSTRLNSSHLGIS